ncbi:JAB1/Mov34/MPN/PAD-1 ubiquitin protease domain-containing protein [Ditylenchus destructor]|uniref:JAB1/Mov34/MPN/PAD-1 ubiquitin protease domain-containing protein n=1 Tax=Ditylenchus destructor TaxID=166010 RepID=A0AAD4RB41_9BILA|nr:JAB1/Mov34/MPN/PAD-1 ubiquitin protease domain-containing protein [Ditylenchus destructor]
MTIPRVVKVHPAAYMSIVQYYERSYGRPGTNNHILGTLAGYYDDDIVQVTDGYAIPFREVDSVIDGPYNKAHWSFLKKSSPREQMVGWFYIGERLTEKCRAYHAYYEKLAIGFAPWNKQKVTVIFLTLDFSFSNHEDYRIPIQAYIGKKKGDCISTEVSSFFLPIEVELETFLGESVALDLVTKGVYSKNSEIKLQKDHLDPLEESLEEMVRWLDIAEAYIEKILKASEIPAGANDVGKELKKLFDDIPVKCIKPELIETLMGNTLRDYSMISELADIVKKQCKCLEDGLQLSL